MDTFCLSLIRKHESVCSRAGTTGKLFIDTKTSVWVGLIVKVADKINSLRLKTH